MTGLLLSIYGIETHIIDYTALAKINTVNKCQKPLAAAIIHTFTESIVHI